VAWDRVRGNTGARTAGVDGQTVHQVEVGQGVEVFLDGLRVEYPDDRIYYSDMGWMGRTTFSISDDGGSRCRGQAQQGERKAMPRTPSQQRDAS